LTDIEVDPLNPAYSTNDGVLFNKDRTSLIAYPGARVGGYTIPDSVTVVGAGAFDRCTGLISVAIPERVTSIESYAFSHCTSLSSVAIPDGVTNIGWSAFSGCPLTSVVIPDRVPRIAEWTFCTCPLTNVTIGRSVTNIGMLAFGGCNLTSVSIPDSVTVIGMQAFSGCLDLTTVTMGRGVTHIFGEAFNFCSRLTWVFFQGNAPQPSDPFLMSTNATAYYLPGTTGWGPVFARLPTAPWMLPYPVILTTPPSFGLRTNRFGFIISWATNVPVVVEACTNVSNPIWSPVATNTLTDGTSYFSDPDWTNYPARFYRLRSP
jgi:hypothetical protein